MAAMRKPHYILLASLILAFGIGTGIADTVILKSGEMYQTPQAWKENGIVSFYRNGRVIRVAEDEVERVIQIPDSKADVGPNGGRPPENHPSPPAEGAAPPLPAPVRQPDGDSVGYQALKWNSPPSAIEGLVSVGTDPAYGGVKQFSMKTRSNRFGRARVDDIVYGFWQDRLYTLTVWTSNFLDFRDVKAEAFRRFGPGLQNRDGVEKYIWSDSHSDRMLAYDYDSDVGYLWMRSKAVHRDVRARFPD
jgi:hypothetical protein